MTEGSGKRILLAAMLLFVVTAATAYGQGCPLSSSKEYVHDPRPLTDEERETFYPLVCVRPHPNRYASPDYRLCEEVLGSDIAAVDGTIDLYLAKIIYGSFSIAGADEAYVTYRSSLEGDLSPGGGILFERAEGKWKFVRLEQGSPMSECVALPGQGQPHMLCYFHQMMCCGSGSESINVMTGAWDSGKSLLTAHDGRREYDMGGKEFCAAGKAGQTLLTSLSPPEREPGVFAESRVQYILPHEINRACNAHAPEDAKVIDGRVRFVLEGDKVKVVLPEGVKSFSVY